MNKKEIETRIVELKGQQAAFFQKKKADRDAAQLAAVREELNALKQQAKSTYRK
jgi:hypothetical protein